MSFPISLRLTVVFLGLAMMDGRRMDDAFGWKNTCRLGDLRYPASFLTVFQRSPGLSALYFQHLPYFVLFCRATFPALFIFSPVGCLGPDIVLRQTAIALTAESARISATLTRGTYSLTVRSHQLSHRVTFL